MLMIALTTLGLLWLVVTTVVVGVCVSAARGDRPLPSSRPVRTPARPLPASRRRFA
jgi:hypothetical protein